LIDAGQSTIIIDEEVQGPQCGLIPLGGPVVKISTKGLRWNLNEARLEFGRLISTSNCLEAKEIIIDSSDPFLWTTALHKRSSSPERLKKAKI
jgi:thiamine pyrophosphokinase